MSHLHNNSKGKGKVHPITSHEGQQGEAEIYNRQWRPREDVEV